MVTIEEMRQSYDWSETFGGTGTFNQLARAEPVPPGSTVADGPFTINDVAEVLAADDGERDGRSWVALLLLKDGRFGVVEGSCDYTGWD